MLQVHVPLHELSATALGALGLDLTTGAMANPLPLAVASCGDGIRPHPGINADVCVARVAFANGAIRCACVVEWACRVCVRR
jgi:hypothetical protein